MSWLASQQRCNERSLYHKLQAMQDTHSRSHASSVRKSSTHERICWDEARRKERKKERKQSWRVDINNLALALFMLVNMISSWHFYTDVKALKKSWLHYQLQKDNTMLWRFRDRVFKKKCSCENASHRLWMMHICKTSLQD